MPCVVRCGDKYFGTNETNTIANMYGNPLALKYSHFLNETAVSLGGLIVFWQGFPYIEVILLIYVVVQLIYNLIVKKPTGYLTYLTAIYVAASFPIAMSLYRTNLDMFHGGIMASRSWKKGSTLRWQMISSREWNSSNSKKKQAWTEI